MIKAANAFKDKTSAPNQLWQTGFTYLKVIGWGWFYLSTVLDDFSRYIVAWKLCASMRAQELEEQRQPYPCKPPTPSAPTDCQHTMRKVRKGMVKGP